MRRKVAAAVVVALALALASCGGGEKKTEVVSKAEVVKQLEAACMAGQSAANALMRHARDRTEFIYAVRKNMETVMDRVGHLETTGSAKADLDAYKSTLTSRLNAISRIVANDRSDWPKAIARERPVLDKGYARGREAIIALGAEHVCV